MSSRHRRLAAGHLASTIRHQQLGINNKGGNMFEQEPLFDDDSFYIDDDGHDYRTGPKHPGLRAWLDELPDVRNEDLYRIDVHFAERIESFYQVMAHKKAEAIEAFDLMFLGVSGAVYGDGATSIALFAPEVEGKRKKLADLPIPGI